MLNEDAFEFVDELMQSIKSKKHVFGGVRVFAFGDFAQLPSVQPDRRQVRYLFASSTWKACKWHTIYLSRPRRCVDQTSVSYKTAHPSQCLVESQDAFHTILHAIITPHLHTIYIDTFSAHRRCTLHPPTQSEHVLHLYTQS